MRFPDFSLPGSDGATHARAEWKGQLWVAYFYPKDNTTGCTTQAKEFSSALPRFAKAGCGVVGISPDSVASHCRFIDKQGLSLLLLADEQHRLAEALGVWTTKTLYGRSFLGIVRSTFLVLPSGEITQEWRKVRVAGHVEEVLAAARAARSA